MKLRNAAKSMLYKSLYFLLIHSIFVPTFFLLSDRFSSAFIRCTLTQCFQAKSIIYILEMQTNILLYSKSGYFPSNIHITLKVSLLKSRTQALLMQTWYQTSEGIYAS